MKKILLMLLLFSSVYAVQLYEIKLSYNQGTITQTDFIVFEGEAPEIGEESGMYFVVGDSFRHAFTFPVLVSRGRELKLLDQAEHSLIIPASAFDASSEVYINDWEGERVLTLEKPVQPKEFVKTKPSPEQIADYTEASERGGGLLDLVMDIIKFFISLFSSESDDGTPPASSFAQEEESEGVSIPSLGGGGDCKAWEEEWISLAEQAISAGLNGDDTTEFDSEMESLASRMLDSSNGCKKPGSNRVHTFLPCRVYWDYYKANREDGNHPKPAKMFLVELQVCLQEPTSQSSTIWYTELPDDCVDEYREAFRANLNYLQDEISQEEYEPKEEAFKECAGIN